MPLAYIMWIDAGAHPEHPIVYPPPGGGGRPPGIWGGSNEGFPTYPIAPGGRPPGTWGGSGEGFPTQPGPLPPTGIWPSPGRPAHPIVIPPTEPGKPPWVIWGGSNEPMPTPPIELPGGGGTPPEGGQPVKIIEWRTAWTEQTGWIVIGLPQVPHPAPSK